MSGADDKYVEAAAEYLTSKNFRSMIEWISAEVLFVRPADPLVFVRDILSAKIEARGAAEYEPADNDRYLRECYEDPSVATTSSSGPAPTDQAKKTSADIDADALARLTLLEKLISASRAIASTLDPLEATKNIITETCSLINADRATLFRVDPGQNRLELMVAEGAKGIFLPIGQGIAGTVAHTGEILNIPDAYKDSRFDSGHDRSTGYHTKTILAAPVRDASNETIGVIQAINGQHGPFSETDEEILSILAAQAGIALRNAQLYHATMKSQERVHAMLELVRAMHGDMGINSLMFTITNRAHQLVDADRCTFFMANHKSNELWAMQGEVDIRIPLDKGIAGAVATSGKSINIPDAYLDDRFNQEVDKASGYRTKSILCMPVKARDGSVVAVIQLINKADGGAFGRADEELMDSFLNIAAPILQNSQLFQSRAKAVDEGNEFTGKSVARTSSARGLEAASAIIEEDEEEEEEG